MKTARLTAEQIQSYVDQLREIRALATAIALTPLTEDEINRKAQSIEYRCGKLIDQLPIIRE